MYPTGKKNIKYVVLLFYADFSKESKQLLKDYDIVAKTYRSDDHVTLGKMDVENHPEYALKYGVTSYPTILFFIRVFPIEKVGSKKNQHIFFAFFKTNLMNIDIVLKKSLKSSV